MRRAIVLLGPPGAGKGTQGKRLGEKLGVPHIASGDLFRALLQENTPLAARVRGFMERGEYVPDDLTIKVVMERLSRPDAAAGFILDGFPRTEAQARALDEARRIDVALYLFAPVDTLVERISRRFTCPTCSAIYEVGKRMPQREMACDVCGSALVRRADDAPDVVRPRLQVYEDKTRPLIDFYRGQGKLVEIDGAKPVEVVESQVDRALGVSGGPIPASAADGTTG